MATVMEGVAPPEYEKGDLVWFDPGVGHVLPGEVMEFHRPAQVLTVQAVIAGKPQVFTLTSLTGVRRRQDLGQNGVEDMIQLSDLNEASLLWNLKIRYDKELIYTYTGSILVAVNPYKMFDIYGLDMVKKYEGQILGTLPPHLFAIGSSAYAQLSKEGERQNQVVVISGESGSGKTESTKLVMQYLAAVNKSPSNLITEQILEASPLLESFGNAKTVRNDNSSRFGKYLEVLFKDGVIIGAKVTEYLLEKSRIVTQAQDERNYHVFYEMLTGLSNEQKQKYGLLTPEKYFYLNQGGNCEIDGKYDSEDFQSLLSAMQVLGFTMDEQDTIFRVLASVLHLGNVYFHRKQLKHGTEGVEIGSDAEIRWTGHLLHLNVDGIKRALTTKTTEARNERLFTPLSIDQALDARDAFAKALYSSLFSWLVQRINSIVFKGTKRTAAISILDIFGFEDFKENSFEQLCINYANENLQFYFNKHIFKLEQQEYARDKIDWQTITYNDNLPVINLIAKKPVGILHLLDDESNFPKATDLSFLEKCHYNHALDELYSRPRMSSLEFGVRHYAGQVWYNVEGFLDKNRDTLRPDVVELLISSKISMLSRMFQGVRTHHEACKTINKANGRFVTMKPRTPTVAARFHDSLQQLLESMTKCNPWFVRCIKPNNDKAPMKLDMPIVLEQLRYTGMLETIRIRKTGYPIRLKFAHFVERYRYLLQPRGCSLPRGAPFRELCRAILDQASSSHQDYQLGTTRVFMRENLERKLEKDRADILREAAVTVQKHVRGYLARRRYRACKKGAVKIQAAVRGYAARKKFRVVRAGVVRAQANFRAKRQRKRYLELKEELKRRSEVERVARERAKVKAQRDEQDRASRAVAGVNHLEIPAELAFIFSKLDDWQPTHSERNLVKVVGGVPHRPDRYYLPTDIDYHAFTKFTNVYFKSHLWGMKREPIKTPFLAKSKDIDYQDSLAIFKLILRFLNDNNLNGKKEVALGDYIVNKGIVNEKLRDEILCQLCNQTWKNDNDANNERGWLLLANCLSCFPTSRTLHKFLLKYVSDHGWDGYKAVCQRKLLQSSRVESQLARTYPPCLLEWRANRKRVNMALPVHFADGEQRVTAVESWTTSEELASLVVRERGIPECSGWSVSLTSLGQPQQEHASLPHHLEPGVKDSAGHDYVLDLIAEMELAPAFPACRGSFLSSPDKPKRTSSSKVLSTPSGPVAVEVEEPPLPVTARRPGVPPPEPPTPKQPAIRKSSRELIIESKKAHPAAGRVRSQSRDHTMEMGLSRKSALNDRYFEDKPGRSRSLDNLLESEMAPPRKLESLGLSQSRLNDRYHSMEKMPATMVVNAVPEPPLMRLSAVSNKEYMSKAEVMMESVSQRGRDSPRKYSLSSNPRPAEPSLELDMLNGNGNDLTLDFDYPDIASQACRSEDDKGSYIRGHPRFIKSHYAGKRAAPGSHSSRAYIEGRNSEKSEYGAKSSALSDTSEAPSLASHVRRVRVPSQASDVDQFLDDLFMPVLDGNLDELSDARSLAASIKGGGNNDAQRRVSTQSRHSDQIAADDEVATLTGSLPRSAVRNVDDYISDLFQPIFVNESLRRLTKADTLAVAIKGGGQGLGGIETRQSVQTSTQNQSTTALGFTPIGNVTSPTPMMPGLMTGMISPPPLMMPGMPSMPMFSPQGASGQQPSSLLTDPALVAYQQSLQRAFLQSAMAQNIQIQQQLLAQNQALQTLLQTQANSPNTSGQSGQTPQAEDSELSPMLSSEEEGSSPAEHMTLSGSSESELELLDRISKVSFREPENGDLWSTEKQQNSISSPGPPLPPKSRSTPIQPVLTTVTRAQVHRSQSQSPPHAALASLAHAAPRKASLAPHTAFTSVLSELRSRKSSADSNQSNNRGIPPPPPPPMPPPPELGDPSEARPFLDPYGRAKTVRIGKWRWPPPQDNGEASDSFLHFKLRQQQRKVSPQKSSHESENGEGVEWEEFDMDSSPTSLEPPRKSSSTSNLSSKRDVAEKNKNNIVRSNLDLHSASSPSSVGKLRISSEMRSKLELVTANHSLRSTTKTEKPALSLLNNMQHNNQHNIQHNGPQRSVSKLEDNRKLMLEQQLAGRWGSVDSVDAGARIVKEERTEIMQQMNIVRSQVERMEKPNGPVQHSSAGWKPAPPPPPVTPHHNHHAPASRTSSFYSQSNTPGPGVPQPIQPVRQHEGSSRDLFGRGASPAERGGSPGGRRASVSTHHTDIMERIEIEESSEFLQPVDSSPPAVFDRLDLARSVETTKTKLFGPSAAAYFTYNRVAWRLNIKKEVFAPNESLSTPLALHLVFCQVVQDTLSPSCIRLGREERTSMRKMLDSYGVTLNNLQSAHHKSTIKKNVVDIAKQWHTYFSRIFPVSGGHQNPDVQYLAVSHSGIRLIRKEKTVPHDSLQVLDTFTFDEIAEVSLPKNSTVQLMMSAGGRVLLYSHRANQIQTMLHRYIQESCKGGQEYVRGVADHMSRDQSLLNFRKGDVIRLINRDQHLQKGWLHGSLNGRAGIFPSEFVEMLARNQVAHNQMIHEYFE